MAGRNPIPGRRMPPAESHPDARLSVGFLFTVKVCVLPKPVNQTVQSAGACLLSKGHFPQVTREDKTEAGDVIQACHSLISLAPHASPVFSPTSLWREGPRQRKRPALSHTAMLPFSFILKDDRLGVLQKKGRDAIQMSLCISVTQIYDILKPRYMAPL